METYSPKSLAASWYDDEPEVVQEFAPILEEVAGLQIKIRDTNAKNPLAGDKSSVALVDLDLGPPYERDGLQLARQLISRHEPVGILLVSRYFASAKYHAIDRQLSPVVPLAKIEKNDIAILSSAQKDKSRRAAENPHDVSRAKGHIESAVREVRRQIAVPDHAIFPDRKALRSLIVPPIDQYFASTREKQARVVLTAKSGLEPYLSRLFDRRADVAWVTIALPTGEVLKWGTADDPSPRRKSEVFLLARQSGTQCLPVTFHRPRFLEVSAGDELRSDS